MTEQKKTSGVRKQTMTKEDMNNFRDEIVREFHLISEGLIDQIKLLPQGHSGIIERLNRLDVTLARMEKESERQHMETPAWSQSHLPNLTGKCPI